MEAHARPAPQPRTPLIMGHGRHVPFANKHTAQHSAAAARTLPPPKSTPARPARLGGAWARARAWSWGRAPQHVHAWAAVLGARQGRHTRRQQSRHEQAGGQEGGLHRARGARRSNRARAGGGKEGGQQRESVSPLLSMLCVSGSGLHALSIACHGLWASPCPCGPPSALPHAHAHARTRTHARYLCGTPQRRSSSPCLCTHSPPRCLHAPWRLAGLTWVRRGQSSAVKGGAFGGCVRGAQCMAACCRACRLPRTAVPRLLHQRNAARAPCEAGPLTRARAVAANGRQR